MLIGLFNWNDNDVEYNTTSIDTNGMPTCQNWTNEFNNSTKNNLISILVQNLQQYNEIDKMEQNNFFLGFQCQKNYKLLIYSRKHNRFKRK